jgi:ArsR family transcriptional regulator
MKCIVHIDESQCERYFEECCVASSRAAMSSESAELIAELLTVMADPIRLRIVSMLVAETELCSCHLEGPLGKSQPTISHHMARLSESGLVIGDKRGKWTYWRLAPERLELLSGLLASWAGASSR